MLARMCCAKNQLCSSTLPGSNLGVVFTPPPLPTPSPQPFNVQKNPNQNMVNLIVSDQYYPVTSLQVHKTS